MTYRLQVPMKEKINTKGVEPHSRGPRPYQTIYYIMFQDGICVVVYGTGEKVLLGLLYKEILGETLEDHH